MTNSIASSVDFNIQLKPSYFINFKIHAESAQKDKTVVIKWPTLNIAE